MRRFVGTVLLLTACTVFAVVPPASAAEKLSVVESSGADTDALPLVVTRTRLLYLGPGAALANTTATLKAKLEDASRVGVPGRQVVFRMGAQVCFALTDGAGFANCPVPLGATLGPRALQIFFDGDLTYSYSTLFSKVVVIPPPPGP
jgi:hypothetical protein